MLAGGLSGRLLHADYVFISLCKLNKFQILYAAVDLRASLLSSEKPIAWNKVSKSLRFG